MAYRLDSYDQALVIDGWQNGIADNPYDGIADMRNVNIASIPGEAISGFATATASPPNSSFSVTSADASTDIITVSSGLGSLDQGIAVSFTGGSLPGGISASTPYWLSAQTTTTLKIYSDPSLSTVVDISGTGTGTMTVYTIGRQIKDFCFDGSHVYGIDGTGMVWRDQGAITGNSGQWKYMGNKLNAFSGGQGIAAYISPSGDTFIFAFGGKSIDYMKNPDTSGAAWTYQWSPSAGTTGSFNSSPTNVMNNANVNHRTFIDNAKTVYFCDGYYVSSFFQTAAGTAFNPADSTTYTFAQSSLLPTTDVAQCLTQLGTNLMIGGQSNILYPWDRSSANISYPIFLPEYNIAQLVTVNTNTFIFVGNRGRIYYTNGTNASLFKKVPDHISGTVEPYFTWGGATSTKNQLYFSCKATANATGAAINQYGGVWAIDLDTKAIRLVNKLSYDTYAGYATALSSTFGNTVGYALWIGWDDGNSGYGIDGTVSTNYIGSQTTIDTDLIPIGTFNKPRDLTRVEYLLTKALVGSQSIVIKSRLIFNTSDTGYSTILTDNTAGNYCNDAPVNFQQARWVQFQIILNETDTGDGPIRLKHIRILGLEGPTMATSQQLGL